MGEGNAAARQPVFEKVVRGLSRGLAVVAGISLLLMMFQMVLDVFLSNVFLSPIESNLEIVSIYHMVAVVFLPLAMVELRHEHIHVDLVVRLMPRVAQRVIYVAGSLVSAAFFGILAYQTLLDAIRSYQIGEMVMGVTYVEIWLAKFILPISFFAILLAVLLHTWQALRDPAFDPTPATQSATDPS